jgi:eukaryotic-like serine/threonine-protein kinase
VSDLTGELIDSRYQLLRILASGGMATIYEALDLRLDRRVAVKIMHSHLAKDEEFVGRFIKEAKAAAALSHPNIVSIQDQGWNEGGSPAVFLVMELIEGETLREFIYRKGSLSPIETLRIISPIISALGAAHRLGIVHRDIKPENILISHDGRVKIADFGLARGGDLGATMTTQSSVVLGSVSYLSPEQVQRGVSDERSDIYSLGITMYEMLTGKKPFEGETPIQIAYMHVNERVPAPSASTSDIPASLDHIVLRATDPNPDKRFSNANAMLLEVQGVLEELDPSRRQLSLELDIPINLTEKSGRKSARSKTPLRLNTFLSSLPHQYVSQTPTAEKDSSHEKRPKKKKLSKRVKRNRAIAMLIVVALVYGIYLLFSGSGVSVPSVVGMSAQSAEATLKSAGLASAISEELFSEDIPAGKVISSSPGGGAHIPENGRVNLVLSKGPERISVPSLAGLTTEQATANISAVGLHPGNLTQQFSTDFEVGRVISSSPTSGTPVKRGTLIDLVISKGVQRVSLTSYIGQSADQAINELTSAGFKVASKYVYSDTVPSGNVVSENPDGSIPVAFGSTVTLRISKGTSHIFVPNIYSLTEAQARIAIENYGLKMRVKRIGSKKVTHVTNVAPAVGTAVKPGATITITLS